jgi:DNA-directed RNA polymerase specialized sigma24 family protein
MTPRPVSPRTPASPVVEPARRHLSRALSHCAPEERALLALLVFERLTPEEAAQVLGIPCEAVETRLDALMVELRAAVRGVPFRPRRPAVTPVRLRRAS